MHDTERSSRTILGAVDRTVGLGTMEQTTALRYIVEFPCPPYTLDKERQVPLANYSWAQSSTVIRQAARHGEESDSFW